MPTVEYLNYQVLAEHGWEVDDPDLFEKAADADLPEEDYGTMDVDPDEYLLDAAEARGHDWPFSCRFGGCGNCAVVLKEGEIEMDMQEILSPRETEELNVRLTCAGRAVEDTLRVVFNAKHMDELQTVVTI